MNRVTLCGRLTRDPELRASNKGTSICTFTLAVDRPRNKDGVKDADFIRCICFAKQGESVAYHKRKGEMLAVDGRLQTGSYEKDGIRHYTTDVIVERADFLGKEKTAQIDEKTPSSAMDAFSTIDDDDIPW